MGSSLISHGIEYKCVKESPFAFASVRSRLYVAQNDTRASHTIPVKMIKRCHNLLKKQNPNDPRDASYSIDNRIDRSHSLAGTDAATKR